MNLRKQAFLFPLIAHVKVTHRLSSAVTILKQQRWWLILIDEFLGSCTCLSNTCCGIIYPRVVYDWQNCKWFCIWKLICHRKCTSSSLKDCITHASSVIQVLSPHFHSTSFCSLLLKLRFVRRVKRWGLTCAGDLCTMAGCIHIPH